MERYLTDTHVFNDTDFPEVDQVRKFMAAVPHATVWSDSSVGNGLNSLSHKHGDFDNEEETIKSLAWIIEHGF